MPFMRDDEHILLFDTPNRAGEMLSVDDLKALRDIGIGTALVTGSDWNKYEPKPKRYAKKYITALLARYQKAGIKVLLPIWERVSSSLPAEWYAKPAPGQTATNGGVAEYLLSPWNLDAQAKALEVMRHVKGEFTSDNCQIISSVCRSGESVMPYDARYFDDAALASWRGTGEPDPIPEVNKPAGKDWLAINYTRLLVEQQRILVETPWREIWTMFHLPKMVRPNCGVQFIDDYYQAFQALKPETINHITFDYFNFPQMHARLDGISKRYDTAEWCGAQYCEGLRDGNAQKAIKAGMRGVILAPCHAFIPHLKIEKWMLTTIQRTLLAFERAQV